LCEDVCHPGRVIVKDVRVDPQRDGSVSGRNLNPLQP
jgi:hypothetical protein